MKAAITTTTTRSRHDSRSGTRARTHTSRTSSGVNTSGINSLTIQGSQVAIARVAAPATKAAAETPVSSTRQTSHSTQAVSSAWATMTARS